MASLQDRLKDLGVQVGTSQIAANKKIAKRKNELLDVLPGSWEETPAGDCFVIRKEFDLDLDHGSRTLATQTAPNTFEALYKLDGLSALPLSEYLFIDTETTGLAGGAGTYVFLIGAAKIIDNQVQFAQFLLQDPGAESAQLAALETFTASSKVIVSYNGKSFDLPRIRTRYQFHGWPNPFEGVYHLDLLHIARRIWKDLLPSCTLGDLEYHILELERDDLDIPGWKVAEYFFTYLQDGDPVPLKHVLYHNEVDVLSLITLLGYISERITDPLTAEFTGRSDLIPLAKFFADSGDHEKAAAVLNHALSAIELTNEQRLSGLLELASIYKKNGSYDAAVPLWEESALIGSCYAKIELAKYFEHHVFDYEEAIHWTLSALEIFDSPRSPGVRFSQSDLEHRLTRLKRKAKQ